MVMQGHIIQQYKTTLGIQGHIIFKNRCNTIRRQIHKSFMHVQCIVNHCLFCCPFFFSQCIVGPHLIYGFRLHLWNQTSPTVMYRGSSRCRDRIVVRFTNVKSLPSTTKVLNSKPAHGMVYLIQHYVTKFVSDLRQVCGWLRYSCSSSNKIDRNDITEIFLKVALNTINQTKPFMYRCYCVQSDRIHYS